MIANISETISPHLSDKPKLPIIIQYLPMLVMMALRQYPSCMVLNRTNCPDKITHQGVSFSDPSKVGHTFNYFFTTQSVEILNMQDPTRSTEPPLQPK